MAMKPLTFLGDSLKVMHGFPEAAQQDAGFQLRRVQAGRQPENFKPMPSIGPGVEELRVWCEEGTFRVVVLARLAKAV